MLTKSIIFFGQPRILACDGKCSKAWGVNNRPKVEFDVNEPDDYAFLADGELGEAPTHPGTWEGGHGKPLQITSGEDLNKWCCRECERSTVCGLREEIVLPDFSKRRYNQPSKHIEE